MSRARELFWYVWKLHRRISKVCMHHEGILTVRGGMTSHAAVVARGMGTCCVSGCGDIAINEDEKVFHTGRTYTSMKEIIFHWTVQPVRSIKVTSRPWKHPYAGNFGRIMDWADQYRKLQVRTNADTPTRRCRMQ